MVTVCPRSLDTVYTVSYYIKWFKTSWAYGRSVLLFKRKIKVNTSNHAIFYYNFWALLNALQRQ